MLCYWCISLICCDLFLSFLAACPQILNLKQQHFTQPYVPDYYFSYSRESQNPPLWKSTVYNSWFFINNLLIFFFARYPVKFLTLVRAGGQLWYTVSMKQRVLRVLYKAVLWLKSPTFWSETQSLNHWDITALVSSTAIYVENID